MAETRKKGFNLAEALGAVAVPDLGTVDAGREQIEYIDIDRIDDDPNNFYELSSLDELAANIELLGLQQPIRVRPNPENTDRVIIVSGHRRRAAIRKLADEGRADLREIPCIRERTESSAALQELRLIYANSDTRKLTSAEISKQAERVEMLLYQLKEEGYEFPGRMRDHVAEACKVSKSKLSRLKVIRENLIDDLKKDWESGKLKETVAYTFAQQSPKVQQLTIQQMTRHEATNLNREYWHENNVKYYAGRVSKELKPRKGPKGTCESCDTSDQRLKRMASGGKWDDHCSEGKCCHCCPNIGNCEYACPHLSGEVAKARSAAQAKKVADLESRKKQDERRVAPTVRLWKRFGEARAAAGLTFEAYARKADVIAFRREKKVEDFEQGRKITPSSGGLPYTGGDGLDEWRIRPLIKAADALGVSLDYLLCRTDDPTAGRVVARSDDPCTVCKSTHPYCDKCCASCEDGCNGQQRCRKADAEKWVHLSYIDGFRKPTKTRLDAVALFRLEKGEAPIRMIATWINGAWHISPDGARIDAECVGWFPLPEEGDHDDT